MVKLRWSVSTLRMERVEIDSKIYDSFDQIPCSDLCNVCCGIGMGLKLSGLESEIDSQLIVIN
jgi:hypothetical protein